MKKLLFHAVAMLVLLSLGITAQANPITCTFTGRGSGRLGGTSFSDSNFTITAITDTVNRQVYGGNPGIIYTIENTSAYITIQNLGTYQFLIATRLFNHTGHGAVGFSRGGYYGGDLFYMRDIPALSSWNMLTSIGPLNGETGSLTQWGPSGVSTSGGILEFSDNAHLPSSFTAEVVPEPSSIIVLAGASVGLLGIKRRRA